ncbi:hypothetical protein ASPZODRAFT_129864 [Penicilliopsis zonata CBS 506.65]|uniref:Uncharacterized protein n=1 Tax=Penicilliopsis zonata CBS 506.65 TaxID=1073090 RepID=A0A1L9SQ80_9EURO|nr:hypothetical protein ASPZODRAFT_129864 [Penicilliopsis zonata CBS 506.65]OJJ49409.1 hypothetical protein ASPZODRAFT_129864 [Penicilliopsis zonata CBS 506.65]
MPRMIATMLLNENRPPSALEVYFARCFGFSLLTLGVLTIMLTGSIPLTPMMAEPVTSEESDPKAPYAVPTLTVTSIYHAISAFYAYTWWLSSSQTTFAIGMVVSSVIASVGLWCVLFASSDGRISRRTGADKRTAGFPFKNSEADKKHSKRL